MQSAPEYLMIQINRGEGLDKNTSRIAFPLEGLRMGTYLEREPDSLTYSLVGVMVKPL
jgi:hypothetical protein